MNYTTFISPKDLLQLLENPEVAIFDCRFDLDDPDAGWRWYQEAHIPGALYAHLERDLCGEYIWQATCQHPFPEAEDFADRLSAWGIDSNVQVVVYDNFQGGIAARLWQMLRWLGHDRVALLDGGWNYWAKSGLAVRSGVETRPRRSFTPILREALVLDDEAAFEKWQVGESIFLDTRDKERFTGETYPHAPLTGHIPGAVHYDFVDHFDEEGLLRPDSDLRSLYHELLGEQRDEKVISYCVSGVSASVNIAVMKHLGLGDAVLYAGSWEGWILRPDAPVEKGKREG